MYKIYQQSNGEGRRVEERMEDELKYIFCEGYKSSEKYQTS